MNSKATNSRTPNAILVPLCPQTPPYSTNQKLSFCTSLSFLSSNTKRFFTTKNFLFVQTSLMVLKSPYFENIKLFFYTNPSISPPKATLFHHKHRKFPPSHNLLSSKEHGYSFVVRSNSLRCKTRTSHRFKAFSPPFCAKNRVRHVPSEVSLKLFPTELWIEVAGRSPACFLVTFCTTQKVTSRIPCRENRGSANLESTPKQLSRTNKIKSFWNFSRFCEPRFNSPQCRLPTNKIKSFPKGRFEVLQTSNQRTKLQLRTNQMKSFSALRRCPCRDGTLRVLFRRPRRQYPCCYRNNSCRFAATFCTSEQHSPATLPPYFPFRNF